MYEEAIVLKKNLVLLPYCRNSYYADRVNPGTEK